METDKQLEIACAEGNLTQLKSILSDPQYQYDSINFVDDFGRTPFTTACHASHTQIVKELLKCGRLDISKQIDRKDKEGCTPLWTACFSDSVDIIKLLIATGLPLDTTCKCKNSQILHPMNVLEVSKTKGLTRITALLERYIQNPASLISELSTPLSIYIFLLYFSIPLSSLSPLLPKFIES